MFDFCLKLYCFLPSLFAFILNLKNFIIKLFTDIDSYKAFILKLVTKFTYLFVIFISQLLKLFLKILDILFFNLKIAFSFFDLLKTTCTLRLFIYKLLLQIFNTFKKSLYLLFALLQFLFQGLSLFFK